MSQKIFGYSLIFLIICNACFEEDKRVSPYSGELTTIEHNIGEYQSYFDLKTNTIVSYNSIQEWDLGFECGAIGWHILINSAKGLFIHKSNLTTFEDNITINDLKTWNFDSSDGILNLTAVGIWIDTINFISLNRIYIIGRSEESGIMPIYKVQFSKVDSFNYLLLSQNLNSTTIDTSIIYKTDSVNFVYYSLSEKKQKNLSPNKRSYDLVFTPYYDSVSINNLPYIPYLVRGVFLNRYKVVAAIDTVKNYNEIVYSDLNYYSYSNKMDFIGFNWKEVIVDFSSGAAVYNVLENRTYIIQSTEDDYFKLKFISYNLNGIDGFPRFEYKPVLVIQ